MLRRTNVVKPILPVGRLRDTRRLPHGKASSHNAQPHPPTPAVAVDAGRDAGVAARAILPADAATAAPNARRRRSAVRSGRRHAARWQRLFRCHTLALLFLLKLRRRARLRRDLQDLEELSYMPPRLLRGPGAKRGPGGPSSSSSEGPESDSSDAVDRPPGPARVSHIAKRFGGGSARASWALR